MRINGVPRSGRGARGPSKSRLGIYQVHGQRVFGGVTTNGITSEIIRILPIHAPDAREHIVSVIVHGRKRWPCSPCYIKFERTRRISHTLIWVNLDALRMVHSDELKAIGKDCLLQLVGHA